MGTHDTKITSTSQHHSTEQHRPICGTTHITKSRTFDVIDLTPHTFTSTELDVLGLGLHFCPSRDPDHFDCVKDINLFTRKCNFKSYWHNQTTRTKENPDVKWSTADYRMLKILNQLEREGGVWNYPKERLFCHQTDC